MNDTNRQGFCRLMMGFSINWKENRLGQVPVRSLVYLNKRTVRGIMRKEVKTTMSSKLNPKVAPADKTSVFPASLHSAPCLSLMVDIINASSKYL